MAFTTTFEVQVAHEDVALDGTLSIPSVVRGVVLFAHGSGSGRFSPRNRFVAARLHHGGFATLLLDLLTPREEQVDERTRQHRFDIDLLAARLVSAARWLDDELALPRGSLGLFGASTGAAAALIAATEEPALVGAVVSRGGRPDLAGEVLPLVQAPTLLVVGGDDEPVLRLNQAALEQLGGEKELRIVPGASHLFQEPGTLEVAAELARQWFEAHLGARIMADEPRAPGP